MADGAVTIYVDGNTVMMVFDAAATTRTDYPTAILTGYFRMGNRQVVSAIAFFDTREFDEFSNRVTGEMTLMPRPALVPPFGVARPAIELRQDDFATPHLRRRRPPSGDCRRRLRGGGGWRSGDLVASLFQPPRDEATTVRLLTGVRSLDLLFASEGAVARSRLDQHRLD
jgi:hypothetical protein